MEFFADLRLQTTYYILPRQSNLSERTIDIFGTT